jgi:hypothetical protein
MRLESYLLEYKEILSPEDANEIIRKKCSDYYSHALKRQYLYRGVKESYSMVIDPSQRLRTSISHNKIFFDLVNVLPSWKAFPRRNRSLMLSTSEMYAYRFGMPTVNQPKAGLCFVFPFNGAKLSIAPTKDFNFRTFEKRIQTLGIPGGMIQMVGVLEDLCSEITHKELDNSMDTYPQISNLSKKIEEKKKDQEFIYELADIDIPMEFKATLRDKSLMNILSHIVEPASAGFKLISTKEYPTGGGPEGHEVWTDGKCVVIPPGDFKRDK